MHAKTYLAISVIVYMTFPIEIDARGKKWRCPPNTQVCECVKSHGKPFTANCTNRNLTKVPKFVQNYRRLKFSGNYLPRLNKSIFESVQNRSLSELYLNVCRIVAVEENTFEGMSLDFVDFGDNKDINQTQLARCFRANHLKGITMSGIPLGDYAMEFFNTKVSEKLEFVRIANCNLTVLDSGFFEKMPNLIELDVSRNFINHLDLNLFSRLEILTARSISLSDFPDFNSSVNLVHIDISLNNISNLSRLYSQGESLENLNNLFLDGNPITVIENNTFSRLRSLESLSLCNMTSLQRFEGLESASLKYFNMSYGSITPIMNYFKPFFQKTTKLEYLNMHSTSLKDLSDNQLYELLHPLCSNLKNLRLAETGLFEIPSKTLSCFRKLESVDMSSNGISTWKTDAFINVTIKKRILFRNNRIRLINESNFRGQIFHGYPEPFLDFSRNPFECSCRAHWFRDWLKGKYYKLRSSLGKNLICHYPKHMQGQKFVDFDPEYEMCFGVYPAVVVGLCVCGCCLILLPVLIYLNWTCSRKKTGKMF